MIQHLAFFRGINVSGQKLIKMEALRNAFAEAGFGEVKTYIQSGNVIFNAKDNDIDHLAVTIENLIEKYFGFHTDVIIRRFTDIHSLVNSSFFRTMQTDDSKKFYITFLKSEYPKPITIPLFSKNKDVEIIHLNNLDFISVSTQFKGIYGFPNSFIEKLTGIPATTRNPDTLKKLLEL